MEQKLQEQEPQQLLWRSNSQPESMVTVTLGRVMNTLLTARPKKLNDSISRLSPDHKMTSLGSLDESLWFLYKYVRDAAETEKMLDEVLVPMIEHSVRSKESKHGGQAMILLNWLFKDELLFQVLATNLAKVIVRKDDHYITFGWCILVRALLEYDTSMDQHLVNGISEKYDALLKILCSCLPHLLYIVCKGSAMQDGFELPSRLSLSAADCFLSLTKALTKKPKVSSDRQNSSNFKASDRQISLISSATGEKKEKPARKTSELSSMEMEFLLWDHLLELISLVERLHAWSRKSRPLHAKGLEKVLKWLQDIKQNYEGIQAEAGSKTLKSGAMLLFSCWKHYSMLLHLEDHKFSKHCRKLIDQYLSGIQYYTENHSEEKMESKDGGVETRKFFLNCLCLLLGRFDGKKFESIVSEYGTQLSRVLLSQLQCHDDDVIDGVVCIFKAALFSPIHSPGSSLTRQMDSLLPLLLHLLDDGDGTARPVVKLIAEFCSLSVDVHCLKEVLIRLSSGNVIQRKNSLDVILELMHILSHSINENSHLPWQDIANNLLERLADEEDSIREKTSNLLPMIDPSLVLPRIVHLVYSSNEKVQSSAGVACIGVLKYHNKKFEVISMLLDCLSNLNQNQDLPETAGFIGEGTKLDSERILRLIPLWAKSVQEWNCFVGPLIDKLFAEPSNSVIVRFLNYISEYLMEAVDIVLNRVLSKMRGQKEIDQNFFQLESGTYRSDESMRMHQSVFEHLCPLLVIRLLPLRIFDDLNSSIMYGQLLNELALNDYGDINIIAHDCVAAFLLNRAFSTFEFQDVRKLAAELCGRIHPQVLLPIACSQLEHAAGLKDILKLKVCLFTVCTNLTIRGKDSISHPAMLGIRKTLEAVLLWPSMVDDEVHKAQHGCIDCLALMICAELPSPELCKDFTSVKDKIAGKSGNPGNIVLRNSVLEHVIHHIIHDDNKGISGPNLGCDNSVSHGPVLCSFRVCMVNVLISACQKISDLGKKPFAKKALPLVIHSVEGINDPEIRAACIQFLFSAVYHLKSSVIPYSSDLLKLALRFLGKESEAERIAGAKLMTSLMAREDTILESMSEGLLEARSLLSRISSTDPSIELRQLCNKLLACLTFF